MSNEPEGFVWPEFSNEKTRIKTYSKMFKDVPVSDAFNKVYGVDLQSSVGDELPSEYRVGDIIRTKIGGVNKNSVEFTDVNYKGTVVSSVNLYKYRKLRGGINEVINAEVVDVKKDKISLDPIKPMTDQWINDVISYPTSQNVIGAPKTVRVKNLQLTPGGFTGKAVVPTTTDFVGEDVLVDAFIPGSQIVLNITDNFEQFIGKNVDAFVLNYIQRGDTMSLICSVKSYLVFLGNCNMIDMFNSYCEESPKWEEYTKTTYMGKITGVINSSKKCGVFVEVDELNITGMVKVSAEDLVKYKPGDVVSVKFNSFDEELYYNKDVQQTQHVPPYIIEDGVLVKCNLKPILEFVA